MLSRGRRIDTDLREFTVDRVTGSLKDLGEDPKGLRQRKLRWGRKSLENSSDNQWPAGIREQRERREAEEGSPKEKQHRQTIRVGEWTKILYKWRGLYEEPRQLSILVSNYFFEVISRKIMFFLPWISLTTLFFRMLISFINFWPKNFCYWIYFDCK